MAYLVRGTGSQVFGPMTEAELRHWLSQKRISIHTQVRQKGSEQWSEIGELPEFADLTQTATSVPQKQFLLKVSGKQFGPLTEAEIRRWLGENRISIHAHALQHGDTVWKQLRDIPDFADLPQMQSLVVPNTAYMIMVDGKISGPMTKAEIRLLYRKNQINMHAQVKPKGSEAWKKLRDLPEFADLLPPQENRTIE